MGYEFDKSDENRNATLAAQPVTACPAPAPQYCGVYRGVFREEL